MKRLFVFVTVWACMLTLPVHAQQNGKQFSPEKFEADLQQFIIQEAGLTQEEACKFFCVYNEMRQKQRVLYERQRHANKFKPTDDAGCMKSIQERDNIEVELRRLQQNYHNKFFDILSPSKVYDVLKAEDHFHRSMLKQWGRKQKTGGKKKD